MDFNKETLLVIAPHADDEVLGCYGLIKKIKENGGKVYVLILSMGGYKKIEGTKITKEQWKKELEQVSKKMGIDDYDVAFFEDEIKHIDTMSQQDLIEIIESKSKLSISKLKPTIVAIPTVFSTHQDHVKTYQVAISALRPHPQKISHMPAIVISYESPEYYFWSASSEFGRFFPNFYLNLDEESINMKIDTLNIYQTQMREGQRGKDSITALSRIRGNEIGLDYAEAFHIHRLFI